MKLVDVAVRQPITVTVGVILSLLAGFVAITRVPVQMTPDIQDVVITVTTRWENASPQEVESEIVDEQEERLQGVSNLASMTSTSSRGQGLIRLEFSTGTTREDALREVSDKLREVPSYPENVDEPVVVDSDPESRDYIAWVMFLCDDESFDVRTLQDFVQDRIEPRFERLPGISEVNVLGGREREVQIRFDAHQLAQRNMTVSDFITALRRANQNFSAGAVAQGKSDIRVRTLGRFRTPEQVLDTVVRQDDSGVVYVRDVATVVETYKEPTDFVRQNGQPTLAINFDRETGSNVIEVMDGLREEIARLNAPDGLLDTESERLGLGGQLSLYQVYDQTDYISQAILLVRQNLLIGGALATLVLLLFLRSLVSVGIIALAIPISVMLSMVALVAMGRTINVVSLAGMAFAVGMVVDNAIVVIENVFRHLGMGKAPRQAARDGTSEVAAAVLASTLTTIVVFLPILMIQESAGQLFRDIALAICAAVGLSYVVSVTVIPSAAALFLNKVPASERELSHDGVIRVTARSRFGRLLQRTRSRIADALDFRYHISRLIYRINGSLGLRLATILVFTAGTAIGIAALIPPLDYLPRGNRNLALGIMIPPPSLNLDEFEAYGDRVEKLVRPFWEGDEANQYQVPALGEDGRPTALMVSPPDIDNYFFVANTGSLFHGAISADDTNVVDVVDLLAHASRPEVMPDVFGFAVQLPLFRLGGSTGSAIKIDLAGADLGQVSSAAGALFGTLGMKFGFQSVRPDPPNFGTEAKELQILPDQVRMTDVGLSVEDLGTAVRALGDGALIGDYEKGGQLIDLKVIAAEAVDTDSIVFLNDSPIAAPNGATVELDRVADFAYVTEPEQIRRVGRQRAVTLEFTPPPGKPLGETITEVSREIDGLRRAGAIPPGVEVDLAGTAGKLAEIRRALLGDDLGTLLQSSLFLAFVVVYLLMCVLFQSWVLPLVIVISVPLATLGGFVGLFWVHEASVADRYLPVQNMDVLTILGFVLLAGVVVNNAILIVAQSQTFLRDGLQGEQLGVREAIRESVRSRVRPIFMSMLTSVGGMLPLVLAPGSGSELYRGLGAVVVGGLIVATLFTLLLVPIVLSFALKATHGEAQVTEADHA